MGNYFNELRWKLLEPTIFFNFTPFLEENSAFEGNLHLFSSALMLFYYFSQIPLFTHYEMFVFTYFRCLLLPTLITYLRHILPW